MSRQHKKVLCVDDFGDEVVSAHWPDGKITYPEELVWVGSFFPSVHVVYACHKDGYKEARQRSYRLFADSDANCNTCKHLNRVAHDKRRDGFLVGECYLGNRCFHPDDWMGMTCYESRWGNV